mgnify:CR=1 FL=1
MEDTVTVSLVHGALKGKKVVTKAGITYYSFQGIPYAKPPVGPLRFKVRENAPVTTVIPIAFVLFRSSIVLWYTCE